MADEANQHKLQVERTQGETDEATVARVSMMASVHAMSTRQTYIPESRADFADHVAALEQQIKQVQSGDMSAPESMLMAQAATLDAIFNCMAQDAFRFIGKSSERAEASMRAALRAQSQCTSTLRVLGELKHPRQIVVARQANVAQHQQINHGVSQADLHPRARGENFAGEAIEANELLTDSRSAQNAATLDTRAKGRAGRKNKALEAVGAVDRTEDA